MTANLNDTQTHPRAPKAGLTVALTKSPARPRLRRLKWNELVRAGDFVAVRPRGFEPWEGPTGFRADAFVKPIYRMRNGRMGATRNG